MDLIRPTDRNIHIRKLLANSYQQRISNPYLIISIHAGQSDFCSFWYSISWLTTKVVFALLLQVIILGDIPGGLKIGAMGVIVIAGIWTTVSLSAGPE